MKIRHIICMALLMVVAGACKKNQETSSFSASIEIDESKTYLDGMKVKWSAGDQIIVYGNGDSKTYGLSAGANTQTGTSCLPPKPTRLVASTTTSIPWQPRPMEGEPHC